jgi:hypothetical protein
MGACWVHHGIYHYIIKIWVKYNGTPISCCFLLRMEQALTPVLKKVLKRLCWSCPFKLPNPLEKSQQIDILKWKLLFWRLWNSDISWHWYWQAVHLHQQQRSSRYCHDIRVNWANETKLYMLWCPKTDHIHLTCTCFLKKELKTGKHFNFGNYLLYVIVGQFTWMSRRGSTDLTSASPAAAAWAQPVGYVDVDPKKTRRARSAE